jgi:hypothetical protein
MIKFEKEDILADKDKPLRLVKKPYTKVKKEMCAGAPK